MRAAQGGYSSAAYDSRQETDHYDGRKVGSSERGAPLGNGGAPSISGAVRPGQSSLTSDCEPTIFVLCSLTAASVGSDES